MSEKDRKLYEIREKYKDIDYEDVNQKLLQEQKNKEFDMFYNNLMKEQEEEEKKGQDVSQEGS